MQKVMQVARWVWIVLTWEFPQVVWMLRSGGIIQNNIHIDSNVN